MLDRRSLRRWVLRAAPSRARLAGRIAALAFAALALLYLFVHRWGAGAGLGARDEAAGTVLFAGLLSSLLL